MEVNNIFELSNIISKEDNELLRFQDCSLVRRNFRCPVGRCRRHCTLQRREVAPLGVMFHCLKCHRFYSVFKDSFFEKSRVPVRLILFLLWEWVCELRAGCAAMSANCSREVVIQQYRYFRDICSWKLLQNDDMFLFGGQGHVVQIDESVVTKRKYNVGRLISQKWVIGLYDVTAKRGHVMYIQNRSAETLECIIQRHVLPGSEIWTDCWRGYSGLNNLNGVSPYIHRTVNHSRNFVDPVTGVCTNHIEGYWSCLKQYLRRSGVMQSPFLPEYIDQFMWKQFYGDTAADRFRNIIQQITDRYRFH